MRDGSGARFAAAPCRQEGTSREWPAIDRNSWHFSLRIDDVDGVVERLIAFDITEGLDGDPERLLFSSSWVAGFPYLCDRQRQLAP